jgi:hypothetical protein
LTLTMIDVPSTATLPRRSIRLQLNAGRVHLEAQVGKIEEALAEPGNDHVPIRIGQG